MARPRLLGLAHRHQDETRPLSFYEIPAPSTFSFHLCKWAILSPKSILGITYTNVCMASRLGFHGKVNSLNKWRPLIITITFYFTDNCTRNSCIPFKQIHQILLIYFLSMFTCMSLCIDTFLFISLFLLIFLSVIFLPKSLRVSLETLLTL